MEILLANFLYTLRVLLVGGILVRFFMYIGQKYNVKYEHNYWASVLLMSQITFWIDYILFSQLFGQ